MLPPSVVEGTAVRINYRMLRQWRKGTQSDPGYLIILFNLAALGFLNYLLLPDWELD